jgi:penicillin-binding protein 1A
MATPHRYWVNKHSKHLMMKINRPVLRFVLLAALGGFFSLILGIASVYLYLAPSLPSVESLKNIQLQTPLRIYSEDGKLIAEFGEKRRNPVAYEQVPAAFYNALIAAEDENFYTHAGVDLKGLARAAYELITTGKKRSGGSTITMQVAKNYYLSSEKTFTRKFTEILLALHIEQELTKKEILELYVNKIYLGKRAYGVESAAQVYYGKSIKDLSLAQLAMIAGLPQAPSAANPINNPERARFRRNYVLARMFTEEFISQEEFDEAASEPISAKYHGLATEIEAPYVAELVRSEMLKRYPDDLYTKGYRVTTTINSRLQTSAQSSIRAGLHDYDRKHGYRHYPIAVFPPIILPEQQDIEVTIAPTIWAEGDPLPAEDKHISLPPSPMDLNLSTWLNLIKDDRAPGDLEYAIITNIDEETRELELSLRDRTLFNIKPEHYNWARQYVTVNEVGPEISADNMPFRVGQKVLVEKINDEYWLAQQPEAQASLVSFDPQNGALRALVGGYDFKLSKFNRAIQADRQPGSSFKPFVYSSALERGFTAASIINDAPVVFEDDSLEAIWRPENYSGKFFGPTRLRQALYKSRNLVSIRLLSRTGIGRTINYISKFGVPKNKLNRDLSLALGSSGLTPYELASAYNTLANGGYRVEPHFIQTIESNEGETLYEHQALTVCTVCLEQIEAHKELIAEYLEANPIDLQAEIERAQEDPFTGAIPDEIPPENSAPMSLEEFTAQFPPLAPKVMDERVNYIMYTLLQDVIKRGTGKRALALNRNDLAGKTGTTNDQKDAWFSGYNNKLVANVWVGFDSPRTLGKSAFGSNTALPIWVNFMKTALEDVPNAPLKRPDGLVSMRIDPETGNRAYPGQSNAIFETFRTENTPKQMEEAPVSSFEDYESGSSEEEEEYSPEQLF